MKKQIILGLLILTMLSILSIGVSAADCGGSTGCNCGDTLNESRTLTASDNLTGCTGNGLSITRSNVVLDCAGNVIGGDNAGISHIGVYIGTGLNNITVRNCMVYNFSANSEMGIQAISGNVTIDSNTIDNCRYGIVADQGATSFSGTITGNTITNSAFAGIFTGAVYPTNITDNTVYSSNNGIYVAYQLTNNIWRNNIYNNTVNIHSTAAYEASYNNEGNYWGHTSCPVFTAGVDSNAANVVDSYAYKLIDGWDSESPADCNPQVSLTSPANDAWASSSQPDFVFTPVSKADTTLSCVLFINDSSYGTNATADNGTATTITASSSLADGSYIWYVNCTDSISTAQSGTRTLKVDVSVPVITLSSPADSAYTNNKSVTYTPSDAFLNTCEWYTINTSNASDTGSGSASANNGVLNSQQLTLDEGSFYWYINCTDTAGNVGLSATRTINYDATDPVISSTASSASSSGATITWTTDESANSRVDYSTNVSGSSSSSGSYTTSHSISLSSLSALTTYYYNVTSCDQAGNCKTDTGYSFNTSAAAAPSPTTTRVSNGRTTSDPPPAVLNYYFTQQTKTVTLRTTDDINFDVAGQRHKASVKQIHSDYVTVTVSSTPQDVDLYVGKPVSVDLNDDNIDDIQLTLIKFTSSSARIKFDAISEQVEPAEKIPAPAEVPEEEEEIEEEEEVVVPEPEVEAKEEAKPFKAGLLIGVLAAAAVIAAIIFAVLRKKK